MLALTILSSWLACLELPALFSLGVMAYQGIIQLAVPQFMGIFWKQGNKYGAITSMSIGFTVAVILEVFYHGNLPWAFGMTSGAVALCVNVFTYIIMAYLLPQNSEEKQRVEKLFAMVSNDQPKNSDIGLTNGK